MVQRALRTCVLHHAGGLDESAVFVNHFIPEGNLINRGAALARLPR